MDSLRSTHARLAALVRHRGDDDPTVKAARLQLARYRDDAEAIRSALGALPPDALRLLTAMVDTDREGQAA